MKKILFVTSEVHPLIKTGGLADVCGSLPKALAQLGQDIRILLPNYSALKREADVFYKSTVRINGIDVNLLETRLPGSEVIVWLVDYQPFYGFPGNPYLDAAGQPWPNNAERFTLFCRAATEVAMDRAYLDWQPDIVHGNDWQSGLVPALLSLETGRPATLFTIHNMAYQGLFAKSVNVTLDLPEQLCSVNGIEFHGLLSFLKSGLVYSDRITTVSPTYAQEIQTHEFGYGLEGLLQHRQDALIGILNGIDTGHWNPETDPHIPAPFNSQKLHKKQLNKAALQERFLLPVEKKTPVFALISRLVEQKGIDLVLDCLDEMLALPLHFVVLGDGDKKFERPLMAAAKRHVGKMAVKIGYDEALSHFIEAGSDIFLMPSRFEPCGLNQIYSQRYGTVPIVRKTGGLADTVTDTVPTSLADFTATGIVFNDANPDTLMEAIKRALVAYSQPKLWRQIQLQGMAKEYSWADSAAQYVRLYQHL